MRAASLILIATLVACDATAPDSPIPAPPETVLTSARIEEIVISWRDVSTNETSFRIEVRSGDGPWLLLTETSPGVSTAVHSGVAHGVTYFYRVAACNDAGCSKWVETSGKWQGGTLPIVTAVQVFPGPTHVRLSAFVQNGGLPTRLIFSIRKKGDLLPTFISDPLYGSPYSPPGENGITISADWTRFGLAPDTDYEVIVYAENLVGSAPTTEPRAFKTLPFEAPAFDAPATRVKSDGAVFTIRINPRRMQIWYHFEVTSEAGDFTNAVRSNARVALAEFTDLLLARDSLALPAGAYKWRAVASTAAGTSSSTPVSFVVTGP